ncbi:MAG TPA: TIM barrel protein [Flavisolibacter sp.]|jgi:hydroxypyruvate isomerase|nr:TIM barrel protein [Flavisolibacter sp.]
MQRRHFLKGSIAAGAAGLFSNPLLAGEGSSHKKVAAEKPFNLDYAFHEGMFRHHAGADFIEQIKFGHSMGFRSIEDNGMRGRTPEQQKKIGETLAKLGMTMGVFVAHDIDWQKPSLSTGKTEIREKFLSQVKESVEVAKRCGAKYMVAVPGIITPGLDTSYQKAYVLETLRRATDILAPHNLVLTLETLNFRDHPAQILPDPATIYNMVKAVNSPACKMQFDIYHVQIHSGNIIPNLDLSWDEIGYLQIGDNPGRKEPTTGEINYKNVFKHIYNKGFKGILGMEHGISKPGKEGEVALIKAYRECDNFM